MYIHILIKNFLTCPEYVLLVSYSYMFTIAHFTANDILKIILNIYPFSGKRFIQLKHSKNASPLLSMQVSRQTDPHSGHSLAALGTFWAVLMPRLGKSTLEPYVALEDASSLSPIFTVLSTMI